MSKENGVRYIKNAGGVVHEVSADQFAVISTQRGVVEVTEAEYKAALKDAVKNPDADVAAAVATSTDERFKSLEQKQLGYEDRLTKLEQAHSKRQGPMTPAPVDPNTAPPENTPAGTVNTSTTPGVEGGLGAASDTNKRDGGPTRVR